jgi:hypothetical protein
VGLTPELNERLTVALNEARVAGLRLDSTGGEARLLLHVLALPPGVAPVDTDTRRVLVLTGVSRVRILLRRFDLGGYGPPIALGSVDEVE